MNGGWTGWGQWTACNRACGTGTKTRYRACANPAPAFGGANCPAPGEESRECGAGDCPGTCTDDNDHDEDQDYDGDDPDANIQKHCCCCVLRRCRRWCCRRLYFYFPQSMKRSLLSFRSCASQVYRSSACREMEQRLTEYKFRKAQRNRTKDHQQCT